MHIRPVSHMATMEKSITNGLDMADATYRLYAILVPKLGVSRLEPDKSSRLGRTNIRLCLFFD